MPLQGMITIDAMRRTSIYAGSGNTQDVSFNAAGQVIGQVKQIESVNVKICKSTISDNVDISGLKHLNRLDSVQARSEWNNKNMEYKTTQADSKYLPADRSDDGKSTQLALINKSEDNF